MRRFVAVGKYVGAVAAGLPFNPGPSLSPGSALDCVAGKRQGHRLSLVCWVKILYGAMKYSRSEKAGPERQIMFYMVTSFCVSQDKKALRKEVSFGYVGDSGSLDNDFVSATAA
jgi:hypothetical protein